MSEATVVSGADPEPLSVGAVAARLGVAPATLRSWGRRYGLAPAGRTAGGHRRYTGADLARLTHMQHLVGKGMAPAAAARAAQDPERAEPTHLLHLVPTRPSPAQQRSGAATPGTRGGLGERGGRGRPGGPGGRVLAVPHGSAEVRGLARAAGRLDADAVTAILGDLLAERGALATWEVLRPVLVAAGKRWERTGAGIEVEHVLSETTTESLRAYRACQPRPVPGRPVLLAAAPEEQHVLPLHVVSAALAQARIPTRMLGPRVPGDSLTSATRRTGASAVLVWRQLQSSPEVRAAAPGDLPVMRPPFRVVVGGRGWDSIPTPETVFRPRDLAGAVALLTGSRP